MQTSKFVLRVEDANGGGPWQGDISERLMSVPAWDKHGYGTCMNAKTHPLPSVDLSYEDCDTFMGWIARSSGRCAAKDFSNLFHWFDAEGVWEAFAEVGLYLSVYECTKYVEGQYQVCFNVKTAKKICSVSFQSLVAEKQHPLD